MHDLIVATTNQGKFREIKELLAGQFTAFYSLLDFKDGYTVVEDQPSYAENAWKKARKIGNRFGIDTLADDSGLEVDALNGRPGIYSSRYGKTDVERIDRLLAELDRVEEQERSHLQGVPRFLHAGGRQGLLFLWVASRPHRTREEGQRWIRL